jgi:hypothetical protein
MHEQPHDSALSDRAPRNGVVRRRPNHRQPALLGTPTTLHLPLLLPVEPPLEDRDGEAREHRARYQIRQHRVVSPEPGQRGQWPIRQRNSNDGTHRQHRDGRGQR